MLFVREARGGGDEPGSASPPATATFRLREVRCRGRPTNEEEACPPSRPRWIESMPSGTGVLEGTLSYADRSICHVCTSVGLLTCFNTTEQFLNFPISLAQQAFRKLPNEQGEPTAILRANDRVEPAVSYK